MDLNKVFLIGNITRDPELRSTPTGQSVCSFGLATNRLWVDASGQKQTQTEFHNIVTWGKLAEICHQYLKKGRKIFVEGRIQTREWENTEGVKKQRTEIIAENMIILDRQAGSKNAELDKTTPEAISSDSSLPDEEIKVENIPF